MTTFRTARRIAVSALVTTAVVAGGVLAAGPASAATLDPSNRIDSAVTISPTSGSLDGSSVNGPSSVTSTVGCPEGFRKGGRVLVVDPSGAVIPKAAGGYRGTVDKAGYGLNGSPLNLTGSFASFFENVDWGYWQSGINTLIWTCDAAASNIENVALDSTSRYFSVQIDISVDNNTWKLVDNTPVKTATTTTLTAGTPGQTSVALTATVNNTAATGTVQFKNGGANVGSPATVTNGVATTTVTGLTPATAYSFTAEYSGDTTYAASTAAALSVTTADVPAAQKGSQQITANVPAADDGVAKGLQLTVPTTAAALTSSEARTTSSVWTAKGSLGDVTVTDDRRDATKGDWNLNGSASAFASGSNSIPASALGWKPSKTAGADTVQVGAEATSLAASAKLGSGKASDTRDVVTKLNAELSLQVPTTAPAGNYTGTLTLTLI